MKQMKKFVIAFCIPIIIFIIGYYLLGYTIKGENFIISDMKAQYVSLFSYLRDVFMGKENILYSFSKGMGGSMLSTFAYYLASPFNIILIFFSKTSIPIALFILIVFKIGLSGGTMHLYLQKHYPQNHKMNYLFSAAYALMGYTVQYYFHVMWLDAVYLLPLVLLGIDRLIAYSKRGMYFSFLLLTIFSNFYTGYMTCIFVFFYFLIQMYVKGQKIISKTTFHFILCSILGVGVTMCLLLPTIIELKSVFRYSVNNMWDIHSVINNLKELLAKLYIGAHNCKNVLNAHGTNLYCGIFSLVLVYFYFVSSDIKNKKRTFFLLFLILLSCIVPFFIYLWHGFSMPNYFMNRNSYLFTFFLIVVATFTYSKIKVSIKQIISLIIIYILMSIILIYSNYEYLGFEEIVLTGIFLLLYSILLYQRGRNQKNIFSVLFLIIAFGEILLNFELTFQGASDNIKLESMISNCQKPNSIYRTGHADSYSGLDSMICNTKELTSFLSTNSKEIYHFMKKAGYPTTGVANIDVNTNTIVIDSLLGIQTYITSREKSTGYEILEPIDWITEDNILYQNPYSLPIGYFMHHNRINLNESNAFTFQNDLLKAFTGSNEDVFKMIYESKDTQTEYRVPVSSGDYYIQIHYKEGNTFQQDIAQVTLNGKELKEWEAHGVFQATQVEDLIELTIHPKGKNQVEGISIYQLNEELFQQQIKVLQKNTLQNIQINQNELYGEITLENNSILFISIPYDKGWHIKVDGIPTLSTKIVDTFLGIELEKGKHQIVLNYIPVGLPIGCIISICSIFLSSFYFIICKKK